MTQDELNHLYRAAQAEMNANEDIMMISPLALADIIEMLANCRASVVAAERYDQLH